MKFIEELVEFANSREKEKVADFNNIDMIKASVICFELMKWMSSLINNCSSNDSYKISNDRMKVEYKYDWCIILREIINNKNSEMSKVFLIDDSYLCFNNCISDEEKYEICKYVRDNYKPIITTYKKR